MVVMHRVESLMLLDPIPTAACGMTMEPICLPGSPPNQGTFCAGRLNGGIQQLSNRSPPSPGRSFIEMAHSLDVYVHVWTIRNEVRALHCQHQCLKIGHIASVNLRIICFYH